MTAYPFCLFDYKINNIDNMKKLDERPRAQFYVGQGKKRTGASKRATASSPSTNTEAGPVVTSNPSAPFVGLEQTELPLGVGSRSGKPKYNNIMPPQCLTSWWTIIEVEENVVTFKKKPAKRIVCRSELNGYYTKVTMSTDYKFVREKLEKMEKVAGPNLVGAHIWIELKNGFNVITRIKKDGADDDMFI